MRARKSNMELLRILAMFLVLLVHADFYSLGAPSVQDCVDESTGSALKVFFEAVSIACVNIFVCLSGWFGIKPKVKSFCNFVFQCLFWLIGLYIVALCAGWTTISAEGLKGCFALTKLNWFIKAYILLYILSPVLNAFVEHAPRKVFRDVLIGFFLFEFVYGWLFSGSTQHIQSGYSTISFIGLYLLARYVRIYQPRFSLKSKRTYAVSIISSAVCVTLAYITPPILGISTTLPGSLWISYVSPYCVALAIAAVVLFSKIELQSRYVNWIAASSFAVFLLHTNPNTVEIFRAFFRGLYETTDYYTCWAYTFCVLILLFAIAVVIDQLRIALWELLCKRIGL